MMMLMMLMMMMMMMMMMMHFKVGFVYCRLDPQTIFWMKKTRPSHMISMDDEQTSGEVGHTSATSTYPAGSLEKV